MGSNQSKRSAGDLSGSVTDEMTLRLARRVSQRRKSLDLSIKECAKRAHLSARYLIQVEAGHANISLKKLTQLCAALEVRPAELLSDGVRGDIDALLSNLNATQLKQALDLLDAQFRIDRPQLIALLGVRGAGKSTIGRALATRLNCEMIELDEEIEKRAGLSLNELFSVHGERYYRRLEGEVLDELRGDRAPAVIATGGSIVTHPPHYALLKSMCTTVYLRATAAEHMERVVAQGDQRPMRNRPHAMSELERLLSERAPLYRAADLEVNTSERAVSEITDELFSVLTKAQ